MQVKRRRHGVWAGAGYYQDDSNQRASVARFRPLWHAISGTTAFLVLLAAATGAGVVAAGLGALEEGLHARTQAAPELAQVVHGPDGLAEDLQALPAGTGRAVLGVHADLGPAGVVLGQGDDGLERTVEPLRGLLVARGGPVLRSEEHTSELQSPLNLVC